MCVHLLPANANESLADIAPYNYTDSQIECETKDTLKTKPSPIRVCRVKHFWFLSETRAFRLEALSLSGQFQNMNQIERAAQQMELAGQMDSF